MRICLSLTLFYFQITILFEDYPYKHIKYQCIYLLLNICYKLHGIEIFKELILEISPVYHFTRSKISQEAHSINCAPVTVYTKKVCHHFYGKFVIHKLIKDCKNPCISPMRPWKINLVSIEKLCTGYGQHMTR